LVEVVRSTNRAPELIAQESEEDTAGLEEILTGREEITREILQTAQGRVSDLGIELIDLRLKRINYVAEVQKDVFERMIAERQRVAQRYRSEGQGEAARIKGERERDLAKIQSEAYRTAQEIRGEAEATATEIYAKAYGRDVTFYTFMKSLETYERTLDSSGALILTTDSELLRYLKDTP
jgi:membrane protease subunit HflC